MANVTLRKQETYKFTTVKQTYAHFAIAHKMINKINYLEVSSMASSSLLYIL